MTHAISSQNLVFDEIEAPSQMIARHTRRVIAGASAEGSSAAAASTIMA